MRQTRQKGRIGRMLLGQTCWMLAILLVTVLLQAGTAGAVDKLHNSTDTGSGTSKWPNGWGIAGGKYGQFVCATCHEPDSTNLKNIRSTISSMNGDLLPNGATSVNVTFLNQTSMGDDSARRTSSNRICEVCHSRNKFHNFSTTSNISHGGEMSHPLPKQNCINCHKHNTGFKAACGGCHGNPPTTTAIGGDFGLVGTPRASNALEAGQAGAHDKHVNTHSMVCDTCHNITNGGVEMPNQSGTIQIGFFGFAGKVTSGTYTPYTSATRGFRFASGSNGTTIAPSQTTYANANKCSNVYCHGGGAPGKAALTGGILTTPRWDSTGQAACGNCHGTTSATPPTMGNHAIHAAATNGYSISCDMCHPNNVNNTHVQGSVRWQLKTTDPKVGASATYNGLATGSTGNLAPSATYGQCSNIACHTDGKGGQANDASPTWGQTLDCSGCHGGAVGQSVQITTGKHAAHTNNAAVLGTNYGCVTCHAKTVSGDTTISSYVNHNNQFVDYSGSKAGKSTSYNSGTGVCSATYCHSNGKGTAASMAGSGWNSATTLDCTGCHGSAASPAFTSVAGEPNYTNQGAGQTLANSHQKHVGSTGATTCVYCHSTTVTAGGAIISGSTTHIDTSITVVQGGSKTFSYTAGSKTCSTISCHGSGAPGIQWGATMPVDCSGCHNGNATAATVITSGKHTAHINNAAVLGDNLGCIECHAKTVSADRTLLGGTSHINGMVDYSGAKAGKSSTYTSGTGVCSATYCHTDGKGTALNMTTDTWSGATTLNCSGCHGRDGTPAFTSVAGEPNYATAGGNVLRSNSHQTHTTYIVGYTGAASCDICHTNTVTTAGTAIKAGSSHLNRSIDVNFNAARATATWSAATKTCNNISCHGGLNATWGDISSAGCVVCHSSLSATHGVHIGDLLTSGAVTFYNFTGIRNSGTVYRIGCANCHPTDLSKHRNGVVDLTINKNKTGASYVTTLNSLATADGINVANSGITGTTGSNVVCASSYCHSNGRIIPLTSGDFKATPNWYAASMTGNRCGMCHDNPPQYAGQSHYVAASTLGNNGVPPYSDSGHMVGIHFMNTAKGNNQNGFLGYSSSGNMAHGNAALATTISCYICHSGIVSPATIDTYAMNGTSSKFRCGSCHTGSSRTKLQNGLIINTALHMNGVKNVVFSPTSIKTKAQLATAANALGWTRNGAYKDAASYDSADLSVSTWDSATKTCLTACHVNQPNITWGAALQCNSCHANQ